MFTVKRLDYHTLLQTAWHVIFVAILITAIISEIIYIITPIKEIFQSLKFVRLDYQQRQWLQEGPLVKTVDDMLEYALSQSNKTCFIELPYDKLVKEGLGGKDPLIGEWAYLIYRTNYNLYPLHVDWGYTKDDRLYHIIYNWSIVPESEPLVSINNYSCAFLITANGNTVTITQIKGQKHAR
ncbi:MAG: hypothetical protein ACP5T7_04095 [bacterium]